MELVFGRESDLNLLREWRLQPKLRQHEPARDAVAFARLATKRWRYHRQTGGIVISAVELRDAAPVRPARDSPFSSWHGLSGATGPPSWDSLIADGLGPFPPAQRSWPAPVRLRLELRVGRGLRAAQRLRAERQMAAEVVQERFATHTKRGGSD